MSATSISTMTEPQDRSYRFDARDRQAVKAAAEAAEARGYSTTPRHKLGASTLKVRGSSPEKLDRLMIGLGGQPIATEDNA